MKIQFFKVELTEEEFKSVNRTSQILSKITEELAKLGMDSIKMNDTQWGSNDIMEAGILLEDLEEECSIGEDD